VGQRRKGQVHMLGFLLPVSPLDHHHRHTVTPACEPDALDGVVLGVPAAG